MYIQGGKLSLEQEGIRCLCICRCRCKCQTDPQASANENCLQKFCRRFIADAVMAFRLRLVLQILKRSTMGLPRYSKDAKPNTLIYVELYSLTAITNELLPRFIALFCWSFLVAVSLEQKPVHEHSRVDPFFPQLPTIKSSAQSFRVLRR